MVHLQGVHSSIKHSLYHFIISNRLLQLLDAYSSTINHVLTILRQLCYVLEVTEISVNCFMQMRTPCRWTSVGRNM